MTDSKTDINQSETLLNGCGVTTVQQHNASSFNDCLDCSCDCRSDNYHCALTIDHNCSFDIAVAVAWHCSLWMHCFDFDSYHYYYCAAAGADWLRLCFDSYQDSGEHHQPRFPSVTRQIWL